MPEDMDEISVRFRTDYFRQCVNEFAESVEDLAKAAEELEGSGIYYDDPKTGKSKSIDFTEMFDMNISIEIEPAGGQDA